MLSSLIYFFLDRFVFLLKKWKKFWIKQKIIKKGNMIKVGEHITLDIIGTTKEYDPSIFEKVIHDIAKAAKVTILNISKYKFEPQGFTILALLAESHISFHTFPEKGVCDASTEGIQKLFKWKT